MRGRPRAEILHPLFVRRGSAEPLEIGHITDTHVDVRADVYEENLRRANLAARYPGRWTPESYNNWNRSFVRNYDDAKQNSDVILLTGDLIDYGRGHWGVQGRDRLGDDRYYHEDRNWFLFYYLLASGDAYSSPPTRSSATTTGGSIHIRRSPSRARQSPKLLINNYGKFSTEEQNDDPAHGARRRL